MTEQIAEPVIPEFELPDRLRRALRHADVSSNEMAEYLEVTRHTISNWINGHTRPPATAVKLWAMRCGVPYDWLAGEDYAKRSTIRRIMEDQPPSRDEILAHAKDIAALRSQLHGPSRRGPIRRSPIGETVAVPSAVRSIGA